MLNIVLFGPPGSGKGTQSENIIMKYSLTHLSTGDILRAELAAKTELGLKAKAIMEKGELVSDEIVIGMIANKLDSNKETKGFIFDGFPRTVAQAKALDKLLAAREMKIDMMLGLEVEKNELVNRLLKRGEETGRADDNIETIENRINVYNTQTTPVMEYYQAQGKYFPVNGIGNIVEISQSIFGIVDKYREGV
jgi:adenylate kinase